MVEEWFDFQEKTETSGAKTDLEKEQREIQALKMTFLTAEEWIDKKLSQGLARDDVYELFFTSGLADRMEKFLNEQLKIVKSLDETKYLPYKDLFIQMLKEWGLDKEPYSKLKYIELIQACKIRFDKNFSTSTAGSKAMVTISLGQGYRFSLIYKRKFDEKFFNLNTIRTIGHEFGHKLYPVVAENKGASDETFAESVSKQFTEYCKMNYSEKAKYWQSELKRISKMHNPEQTSRVLARIYFKTQNIAPILKQHLYSRHTLYEIGPETYTELYPKEQILALLKPQ